MTLACFSGNTADDVWQQAADALRSNRASVDPSSRGEPTLEVLHTTFMVEDPRQRWVSSRLPAINPAFALAEVVWIMDGRDDSAFINFWNPQLPKYAGHGETYDGAYGHRLRREFGVDQLERAYRALEANPPTRQVVLQIWGAATDLPQTDGQPSSSDIPCNIVSLLKIRDNRLHWTQIIRSNDLILGVPHNFVQFTAIQEVMAGWLQVELGPYVQWSDSLHVYQSRLNDLHSSVPNTAPASNDSLCLPKRASDQVWHQLAVSLEAMTQPGASSGDILRAVKAAELPLPYRNILCVVAADAARRLGSLDVADDVAAQCSNPLLLHLWQRWRMRVVRRPSRLA